MWVAIGTSSGNSDGDVSGILCCRFHGMFQAYRRWLSAKSSNRAACSEIWQMAQMLDFRCSPFFTNNGVGGFCQIS